MAILEFLASPDEAKLTAAIGSHPLSISHPLMMGSILHLWRVSRQSDKGDLDNWRSVGGSVSPEEYESAPPAGTMQAARDALKRLVAAWSEGLLPSWRIVWKPPKRRRGRKWTLENDWFAWTCLDTYEELMKELRARGVRRPSEESERNITQLATVVKKIFDGSILALYAGTNEPAGADPLHALLVPHRLPQEVARKIVKLALKKDTLAIREYIAYGLLDYGMERKDSLRPDRMRGIIERQRAREKNPR